MANELILIIEDNPKNLKLVRDTLQVKGYQTIQAETGEEGVRLAHERQPALTFSFPGLTASKLCIGYGRIQRRVAPRSSLLPRR